MLVRHWARMRTVVGAGLTVIAVAALPAVAQADPKGVVGLFGVAGSGAGGQLNTPAGIAAVNHATGDIYVVDKNNNRVQRFSSAGTFELAWGKNVVVAGRPGDTGTGFEVCTVADDCQGLNNNQINALGRAPLGGELFEPGGVAVDQADGSVYVTERQNFRVSKFTADGGFVLAWGRDVVAPGGVGNQEGAPVDERQTVALAGTAGGTVNGGTFTLSFNGQVTGPIPYNAPATGDTTAGIDSVQEALEGLSNIAVGEVAVSGAAGGTWTVQFAGALGGIDQPQLIGDPSGLTTTFSPVFPAVINIATTVPGGPQPAFEICTVAAQCQEGKTGTLGGELGSFGGGAYPAVVPAGNPNAGNVVVPDPGNRRVQEYTPSGGFVRAFGADVDLPSGGAAFEICTVPANCTIAAAGGNGVGRFADSQPTRAAVDPAGAVYTVESATNFRVQKFTPQAGPPALAPSVFVSGASNTAPTDVAIGVGGNVLVARSSPAGASTCPSGGASPAERRVHEYTSAGAEIADSPHMRCAGIASSTTAGLAANPVTGDVYITSHPRVFVLGQPPAAPTVSIGVGGVGTHTAQLNGLINAGGPGTPIGVRVNYHFEYREVGAPAWIALSADKDAGNGFTTVAVTHALSDLDANTAYEAKLVTSRPFSGLGTIETAPQQFTTSASQPDIDSVYVTDRDTTTATLNARINPNGEATTYHFEYGPTAAYGTAVPAVDASAGNGVATQIFSEAISGLAPGAEYHYRVTATNTNGANRSSDHVFTTRSGAPAPSGRTYELVSPADKIGGSGIGPWYAGVGSHGTAGIPAGDGDRYASEAYLGGSLADGGFSYGSDWTLGQRSAAGWVNKPFFNRVGGFGTGEFAKVVGIGSASDDLSLMSTSSVSQISIFEEQAAAWGDQIGAVPAPALREWESDRWEIAAPVAPSQLAGGLPAAGTNLVAAGGGYVVISGGVRGVAGPGDPTNAAFAGDPSDFVAAGNGNVYIDDVTAGLSDSFPGAGIRSLANVCTGTGPGRTEIPSVTDGKIVSAPCPGALAGRDERLVSSRGASTRVATSQGAISSDGSRVFFMSPDHRNSANNGACLSAGGPVDTKCPPQVYVRQRNGDGSVTTRWISESAVAGQEASLMAMAVFEGATPDGDKAFFRTASPLTADDPNGGTQQPGGIKTGTASSTSVDLYMYDFPDAVGADPGSGTLTRLSAGPTGAGDANVATSTVDDLAALRAFGADGSRVYFVTAAPLTGVPAPSSGTITTPGGTASQNATRNLYLFDAALPEDRRWRFIAQLPASSALGSCAARGSVPANDGLAGDFKNGNVGAESGGNCVRPNTDGSLVTLFTDGRLTADDPDSVTGDVYAYDAASDELVRLSAAQDGAAGGSYVCVTSGATRCHGDPVIVGSRGRAPLQLVVGQGPGQRTVFFESASRLVAEDVNDVYDVYQWHDGTLSLLSTGATGAEDALYRGNDRTGTNVYISTRDRLSWQDRDAVLDVYSARLGGGIAEPDLPPGCVLLADGCQGDRAPRVSAPETSSAPGSTGNAEAELRTTLAVDRMSSKARRRAARSGVLRLTVRTNQASRVTVAATAMFGRRERTVATKTVQIRKAGKKAIALRLNRAARRRLSDGRALRITARVSSPGAKSRTMTVRLPGVES